MLGIIRAKGMFTFYVTITVTSIGYGNNARFGHLYIKYQDAKIKIIPRNSPLEIAKQFQGISPIKVLRIFVGKNFRD